MLEYPEFKAILDDKIFNKSKADLIAKVASNPGRFVGLFRPTKPEAKLLQNISQSNEIRFGDAFEAVVAKYLNSYGWNSLQGRVNSKSGDRLEIDHLLEKEGRIIMIEQKVRDDHDSSKIDGQVNNFLKKARALSDKYGKQFEAAYWYFIDPGLVKNRKYYEGRLDEVRSQFHAKLSIVYGSALFEDLNYPEIWTEIQNNLHRWREDIPGVPILNFDLDPQDSADELVGLPLNSIRRLFKDERLVMEILPVLFPTGETLRLMLNYYSNIQLAPEQRIAEIIEDYLNSIDRDSPTILHKAPVAQKSQPAYFGTKAAKN